MHLQTISAAVMIPAMGSESEPETIGHRLRRLRRSANVTQKQLAASSGVGQGQISMYELGKDVPGMTNLSKLVSALRALGLVVSMDDFSAESLSTRGTRPEENVTDVTSLTSPVTKPVVYRGPSQQSGSAYAANTRGPLAAGGIEYAGTAQNAPPRGTHSRYVKLPSDKEIATRLGVAIPELRKLRRVDFDAIGSAVEILTDVIHAFARGQITSTRTLEPRGPGVHRGTGGRDVRGRGRKKP